MYLPENHARLKAAHTYVSEDLRALGIPFVSRGAGFFIWVDLRKVMQVEMQVVGWWWGGGGEKAPSSRRASRAPLTPPSTCPRPPLRRRCCSGVDFWRTRCCCPLAKPLSAKSPAGSAWSSRTRPTGFTWVSGLGS